VCQGNATAVVTPAILSSLASTLPPAQRGVLLIRMYTIAGAGFLLVPLIAGLLFAVMSVSHAAWLASVTMALFGAFLYFRHRQYFRRPDGGIVPEVEVEAPRSKRSLSRDQSLILMCAWVAMFDVGVFEVVAPIRLVHE